MDTIEEKLQQLAEIRSQMKDLKSKEEVLKEEIHSIQPDPGSFTIGNRVFKIGEARPVLKITDESIVPSSYFSEVPDKPRIRKHFVETGEIIPGTEIEFRPGMVTIRKLKE